MPHEAGDPRIEILWDPRMQAAAGDYVSACRNRFRDKLQVDAPLHLPEFRAFDLWVLTVFGGVLLSLCVVIADEQWQLTAVRRTSFYPTMWSLPRIRTATTRPEAAVSAATAVMAAGMP